MIWSAPCWATASAGIAIVSNFGAANPQGAARASRNWPRGRGLAAPSCARRCAGRTLQPRCAGRWTAWTWSARPRTWARQIAQALVAARRSWSPPRVALTLGPALAHFGWDAADWPRLGRATIAGHMLECGLQVTGGYFSVPGLKDVPDLHKPASPSPRSSPMAGSSSRGRRHRRHGRCRPEQLLYEVHDPARYLTPDVTADLSQARVVELGADRVAVQGVTGHARPDELKVNVCYRGGWLAEAEISRRRAGRSAPAAAIVRAPGSRAATARRSHRRGQRAGRRRRHAGRLARRPGADVRLRLAATRRARQNGCCAK